MNRWALPRAHNIGTTTARAGRAIAAAAVLATAIGAAASAPHAAADASSVIVKIRDYNFQPGTVNAVVDDTVTFQNVSPTVHRIVADDGSFDSRDLSSGTGFNATMSAAGALRIHCEIHPSMTATIVVTDQSGPTTSAPASSGTPGSSSAAIPTTMPLPTELADTGLGDTALVVVALSCLGVGSFAMSLHRRRQTILAAMPNESAWRSVTVGQRHHDDFIARRRN